MKLAALLGALGAWIGLLASDAQGAIRARVVATGLSQPVFATAPPGDDGRLFVVEKEGTIRVLDLATGRVKPTPFLTIPDLATNGEQGLLGLAFHPDYATNGLFFINATRAADGATEIRRYQVSAQNPDVASPAGTVVLRIDQPYANHNGGWLGFGPDGYLYIASGDGGSGLDPENRAQNLSSLLGKILRIDVNRAEGGRAYAIPADNPFARGGGAPEIWHYGLRNPWRCSFDRGTGDFWIGDVGQSAREEVDFQPARQGGWNFGWRVYEGDIRTPNLSDPAIPGVVPPVHAYSHEDGQSITGGYVFRWAGEAAAFRGSYVFGDFATGRVWTLRRRGGLAPEVREVTAGLTPAGGISLLASFAEDDRGRLYALSLEGTLYRLVTTAVTRPEVEIRGPARVATDRAMITVSGRARAAGGVRDVWVRRAGDTGWRGVGGRESWRVRLEVRPGENRFFFQCVGRDGRRSVPESLIVQRR